jgi:hypothetical protein
MLLAQDDKQHKKRLKEAQKTYNKFFKAFKQGKISKDELKERLRPYKYELKELGYPVKIKDDDDAKEESKEGTEPSKSTQKITVAYKPWTQRSALTISEIERNVDLLSIGSSTSENLKRIYASRYGEELPPPEDLVPFENAQRELPSKKIMGALPSATEEQSEGGEEVVAGEKRSFWKSIRKGKRGAATEQ